MRMDEARALIGATISAAIVRDFMREHREHQRVGDVPCPPTMRMGEHAAGHDASRVPAVPLTQLRIDRDSADPGVVFTWKVESGQPPYAMVRVPPHWLRDVVRPGYAVIDAHPVLQILAYDRQGRPAQILTVVVGGGYDPHNHGWRAHGAAVRRGVTWAADGHPHITS
jgi:hypothetical protein